MPIRLDVIVVLRTTLYIHSAGIPIALFRNALWTPVGPYPELRIPEPVRALISFERLPVWPEWTDDRIAGEIGISVLRSDARRRSLLAECCSGESK